MADVLISEIPDDVLRVIDARGGTRRLPRRVHAPSPGAGHGMAGRSCQSTISSASGRHTPTWCRPKRWPGHGSDRLVDRQVSPGTPRRERRRGGWAGRARAVEVQLLLADQGKHRAPAIPDLIIAATAEPAGLTGLHLDKDSELIAGTTGQRTERLRLVEGASGSES